MSSEWTRSSFTNLIRAGVLEIGDGYRSKNSELGGEGLIFLRAGHVKDTHIDFEGVERFVSLSHERFGPKVAKPGDVVVTTKGNSTGRVAFVTAAMPAFVYSPHLSYWRSKSETVLNQGFLRIWSRSKEFVDQLEGLSRSTDMAPYLSLSDQRGLRITLPPAGLQKSIGELGDALDDRITLLRETNATLESIAQALFKSWFVDFDPVRAKLEGRAPEGMDEATAALFPSGLEESELGLVPRGWSTSKLGEQCRFQKGCSYKGDGLSDDRGAYMFNLGCFNAPRVFAFEKIKRYTGDYKPRHSVTAGDLIIANTDMTQARDILGRPLIVPVGFDSAFISHHVFKVELNNRAFRNYLFFCLGLPEFRERAVGYATGTTVLALPKDAIEMHPLVVPSANVLDQFNQTVEPIFEAIQNNQLRAESIATLRDTLLPRLISGQLRLPEAEALGA